MIFNLYLLTQKQEIVGPIKEIKISEILLKKNRILFKEFPNNGVVRGLKDRNDWSKIRNSRMYKDNFESPLNLIPINNIISDHLQQRK